MCSSPLNRRRSVRGCQGWQLSTFCIDVPLLMAKLGETCFSMTPAQPLHQIRDFYGFSLGTTNTWGAFSRTGGFIIRCKKHLFESKAARHHWFPPCVSSGLERMCMQTWINMKWKWPCYWWKTLGVGQAHQTSPASTQGSSVSLTLAASQRWQVACGQLASSSRCWMWLTSPFPLKY